jgi:anaerobic magnesium-protoporphyrin IX monomethyl ester cyclase
MDGPIVLLNPPYERVAPGYRFLRHVTNRSPSLGLLHLAAMVRAHGFVPHLVESDVEDLDERAVVERIVALRPALIGITLFTVGVWSAAQIAAELERRLPGVPIVIGGPHVSSMGRETLERFPQFHLAVVGEGEWTFLRLLQHLERGEPLDGIPSLILRRGAELHETGGAPLLEDLDSLPLPAWDLLPGFPQAYKPAIFDFPRGPVATLAASRGCPFHCRFCDTSTFGAKVRAYSPAAVVGIMEHLHAQYGVRHLQFVDDLFLASRKRVLEFCDRLQQARLPMTWTCNARVDTVAPDVLERMRAAGCWEISFGLETGSDELLKAMDKLASVEKSEQALRWAAAAGIRTKGLFMLGYPGETEQTIAQTRDFVRRLPLDMLNLTKFTPYPGSPIYVDLYGTKIRPEHWSRMNGMNFLWAPEGFTVERLDREYQALLRHFYERPRVLWHYGQLILRNPEHLVRTVRFLLGGLVAKVRARLARRGELLVPQTGVSLDP